VEVPRALLLVVFVKMIQPVTWTMIVCPANVQTAYAAICVKINFKTKMKPLLTAEEPRVLDAKILNRV
jgi:hypothetical protein